ncbi:MAG: hypothetical protein O3B13_20335 [Planctomycetota bacterium]|nr:hypothetical protein [Planctomycetota bacterium]MDA1165453.1 hypothetical protein [Planctomycetota bacterium]
MAIEFSCPSCGAAIRVPDAAAGRKGSCPTCKAKLLVPTIDIPLESPIASSESNVQLQASEPQNQDPVPIDQGQGSPAAFPTLGFESPVIQQPMIFPQSPTVDSVAPLFPGPPENQAVPFQSFPEAAGAGVGQPIVPTRTSIARQVRRRSKGKKSGLWFPVLCGIALVGGMSWLYVSQGPSLNGDRVAFFMKEEALEPRIVDRASIEVSEEIRDSVLMHFAEDRQRLKSQLMETQFSASAAGLEIQILTGSETRFVRFPIDKDLRSWYTDHYDLLETPRRTSVKNALKTFFTDWDVAIRNQQGVEDAAQYRDSVGLASSVEGLGFNVSAKIDQTLYPCVYEDAGFLYFLLPPTTQKFKVIGARVDRKKSNFPGEYDVTIRTSSK